MAKRIGPRAQDPRFQLWRVLLCLATPSPSVPFNPCAHATSLPTYYALKKKPRNPIFQACRFDCRFMLPGLNQPGQRKFGTATGRAPGPPTPCLSRSEEGFSGDTPGPTYSTRAKPDSPPSSFCQRPGFCVGCPPENSGDRPSVA